MGISQHSPRHIQAELHRHSKSFQVASEHFFGQWLCEYIRRAIGSSDRLYFDFAFIAELSKVMVANINVFDLVVIFSSLGKVD